LFIKTKKFHTSLSLKLANVMKSKGVAKIADLGFAKQLRDQKDITKTVLGTPLTMAPEVLEE
jgi:serine/threonine protein kinase